MARVIGDACVSTKEQALDLQLDALKATGVLESLILAQRGTYVFAPGCICSRATLGRTGVDQKNF